MKLAWKPQILDEYYPWFAWYPVLIFENKKNSLHWLCWVEKKVKFNLNAYRSFVITDYRRLDKNANKTR